MSNQQTTSHNGRNKASVGNRLSLGGLLREAGVLPPARVQIPFPSTKPLAFRYKPVSMQAAFPKPVSLSAMFRQLEAERIRRERAALVRLVSFPAITRRLAISPYKPVQ